MTDPRTNPKYERNSGTYVDPSTHLFSPLSEVTPDDRTCHFLAGPAVLPNFSYLLLTH